MKLICFETLDHILNRGILQTHATGAEEDEPKLAPSVSCWLWQDGGEKVVFCTFAVLGPRLELLEMFGEIKYNYIGSALHNNPSFSCSPLVKLIAHHWCTVHTTDVLSQLSYEPLTRSKYIDPDLLSSSSSSLKTDFSMSKYICLHSRLLKGGWVIASAK